MRPPCPAGVFPVLLLHLALSCSSADDSREKPLAGLAFWSEFETTEEVERVLPFLRKRGFVLNRSITLGQTPFEEFESIVRSAQKHDVTVRAWPELSEEDGRWPSVSTRHLFIPFCYELMDFIEEKHLPVDTFYVDLEPPLSRGRELLAALENPGASVIEELLRFYEKKVNDPDFEAGKEDFKKLVDDAHARGFKVFMTTIPFILDDFADGDPSIQRALESPVEGIDWDEYSFQVYTTMFSALYGLPLGPGLVYDYGRTAVDLFGDKAALDLGLFLPGQDVFTDATGFTTPEAMEADADAAVAAGIPVERLHLFSLEGIVGRESPSDWFDWDLSNPSAPSPETGTTILRGLFQAVDQSYP